eukprot:scaffold4473_cov421-Prasinococcus_capsulatus_cf.AAC.12
MSPQTMSSSRNGPEGGGGAGGGRGDGGDGGGNRTGGGGACPTPLNRLRIWTSFRPSASSSSTVDPLGVSSPLVKTDALLSLATSTAKTEVTFVWTSLM